MSSAFLSIKPFCVTRHLGWKSVERQSCEQNGLFAADFWLALHVKWARVARTGPRAGTRTSLSIHGTDDYIECRHASKALCTSCSKCRCRLSSSSIICKSEDLGPHISHYASVNMSIEKVNMANFAYFFATSSQI